MRLPLGISFSPPRQVRGGGGGGGVDSLRGPTVMSGGVGVGGRGGGGGGDWSDSDEDDDRSGGGAAAAAGDAAATAAAAGGGGCRADGGTPPGRAVQVDPIKPTLKAPGSGRLKLKCDEPLSNFAFKFNLRRYTQAAWAASTPPP